MYRRPRLNLTAVIALALTALVVLVLANALPLMTLEVQGRFLSGTLWDAVLATDRDGFAEVAVLVALMAFFAPLLQLLLLLYLAMPLRRGRRPRLFVPAMHALSALRPWSLVEVFLLGALIAAVKLGGLAEVSPDAGLWAFAALTVLLAVLSNDDIEYFWSIGQRCP